MESACRASHNRLARAVVLNALFLGLSVLGIALLAWQWLAARRFPLHRRVSTPDFHPGITLLKPLKGCDPHTEACLRSWLAQRYPGPLQVLFAVASGQDPVVPIVRRLLVEFPSADAQLLVCDRLLGTNLKVAKLAQLQALAKHPVLVISDADVLAPADLLSQVVQPLETANVGLVNCFYRLQDASNLAMRWEAVATNSDFWAQVLQSNTLKPMDFALGAVMAVRRSALEQIGGFAALADCLADDYQLGNRIAKAGFKIALCPVPVDCRNSPATWPAAWKHQLRWARTIRVCQPLPYFFSILSNPGLWPLLLLLAGRDRFSLAIAAACWGVRMLAGLDLQKRLIGGWRLRDAPVLLLKDLLHAAIWLMAFLGDTVEWRGRRMRLRKDGSVIEIGQASPG